MPPKKSKTQNAKAPSSTTPSEHPPKQERTENDNDETESKTKTQKDSTSVPSKRKANNNAPAATALPKKPKSQPQEPPRRSARTNTSSKPPSASQLQTLRFLLSPSATTLLRPADERSDLEIRGQHLVTYSGSVNELTPFQELVCAVVLSRPISHALGLRTIRTIFNEPWCWDTAEKIKEAGEEGRRQALWDARTQHKGKTADELGMLAEVVSERFGGGLEGVREKAGKDVEAERKMLRENVKGLGPTGLDIFCRRVQGIWGEVFPFVDKRTGRALGGLGLPEGGEGLRKLVNENWGVLGDGEGEGEDGAKGADLEERKRRAFVRILEGAVGAELEGKADVVLREAGKMGE